MAFSVDRPVEIAPRAVDLDVGLINVPAAADLAAAPLAQGITEPRRQLGFPIPHRLVGEDDAADQEYLGQITQAQLVTQAPEYHQKHYVTWHLDPVQHRAGPLVVPPFAVPAPEAPKTVRRPALLFGG